MGRILIALGVVALVALVLAGVAFGVVTWLYGTKTAENRMSTYRTAAVQAVAELAVQTLPHDAADSARVWPHERFTCLRTTRPLRAGGDGQPLPPERPGCADHVLQPAGEPPSENIPIDCTPALVGGYGAASRTLAIIGEGHTLSDWINASTGRPQVPPQPPFTARHYEDFFAADALQWVRLKQISAEQCDGFTILHIDVEITNADAFGAAQWFNTK